MTDRIRTPQDVPDEHPPPTLAEFLLVRLDERERAAQTMADVFPSPWDLYDRGHSARVVADGPSFYTVAHVDQTQVPSNPDSWPGDFIAHIALHDPARVLAEVAAKRRIVELHTQKTRTGLHLCPVCVSWETWRTQEPGESLPLDDAPCTTLRLLALPYADRPGYRAEYWAP